VRSIVLALLTSAACASGGDGRQGAQIDAPSGDRDAAVDAEPAPAPDARPDASPDAPSAPMATLLLTEVVLAPTAGEFIEIANPTGAAVALSNYYLSDNGNYFRLPAGVPTVDSSDFIAKFPAGASIPAHGGITVALDTAANFTTTYGVAPTYSIASGTMTTVVANGAPNLTNGGELVVLFHWDGQTDLVQDVDLVLAGAPTSANGIINKSGIELDGPDPGTITTAYATDALTMHGQASTPASGKSTKRLLLETGHEDQLDRGNGINGDDETSEDTAVTWDSSNFSDPTPGAVPAAIM
jgi:hypothetical protein